MSNDTTLSDEVLHAFVDGELDADEQMHILRLSEEDDDVRRRICTVRGLKDWVKNAYDEVPEANWQRTSETRSFGKRIPFSLTAGLALFALLVGIFSGRLFLPPQGIPVASLGPVFLELDELFSLDEAKLVREGESSNIMLHVETNDVHRLDQALSEIESFLAAQHLTGNPVNIEVIANGYGLDLMRVAQTPYEQRLREIAKDEHLTLLACRRAIQRLEEVGMKIDLIPEAGSTPAALDRIIQRLREGWVYVKV
jgi:hypothetical protein